MNKSNLLKYAAIGLGAAFLLLVGIIAAGRLANKEAAFKPSPNVVEMTKQNVEQELLDTTMPIVLDFNADWCDPCQAYKPTFHKLADEYKGRVKFISVNIETVPELAALFGIRGVPTTIFLKDTNGLVSGTGREGQLDEAKLRKLLDDCLKPDAKLTPVFEKKKAADPADPNATTKDKATGEAEKSKDGDKPALDKPKDGDKPVQDKPAPKTDESPKN